MADFVWHKQLTGDFLYQDTTDFEWFGGIGGSITLPQIIVSGAQLGGEFYLPSLVILAKGYKGSVPESLAMNAISFAISEYNNFPFNSFTKFNGEYLSANQNGIYELDESATDDGGYFINSNIKSGIIDSYSKSIHRLRDAFILYKSDGDIKLTTKADKKTTRRYIVPEQINGIDKAIKKRRIKFERGIKNRFFDFNIENLVGAEFEVDTMIVYLEPITSKRR